MTSTSNLSAAQLNKPVLKEGAVGDAVKELQKLLLKYRAFVFLNQQGACVFPGNEVIDGVFGRKTTDAVKLFQGMMFLKQDGIVGNMTWQTLFKGVPVNMPILKKGSQGDLVKLVQERMSLNGLYNGKLDGDFGAATETAVKALQKKANLTLDGVISDRTWATLSKINTVFC